MRSVLRGWCFCESSVSNLVKDFLSVLDLAKFDESVKDLKDAVRGCAAKRAPPLAPPVFKEDLSTKTFTSPKADRETVGNLYEKEFDEKLGEATELLYESLQWTDEDVGAAALAEAAGKLVKLKELRLSGNQIGDAGVAALAEVVGKLPQLKELGLNNNRIGDAGFAALAEAVGKLPQLEKLYLSFNSNISQQAKDALKAALPKCCGYQF